MNLQKQARQKRALTRFPKVYRPEKLPKDKHRPQRVQTEAEFRLEKATLEHRVTHPK